MAIKPILLIPDPVLRQVAQPVVEFDDALRALLDDMLATMYDAPGIGLAGPQIGVAQRIMVIDIMVRENDEGGAPLKIINPEIIDVSDEPVTQQEGCLSIPEVFADVTRPSWVKVKYFDEHGAEQIIKGEGLMAACLQHEIDHLDGKLFIDYLSSLKRTMLLKKFRKLQKLQESE